jgi:hypothetical protein
MKKKKKKFVITIMITSSALVRIALTAGEEETAM